MIKDGKEYIFIDTAGLRRKSKIKEELERYSVIRAVSAVERADIVVLAAAKLLLPLKFHLILLLQFS